MGKRVDQILGNLPLENKPEAVLAFLEREVRPIITRLRESNNEIVEELAGIDLSAIEADITALEAAVDALEVIATDHETRIDALEAGESTFKTTMYSGYGWAGGTNLPLGGGPRYFGPIGQNPGVGSATLIQREMKFGRSGTITNFRYHQLLSSGNANTMTVALAINGVNTALIFTGLAGTNVTEQGPDTSEVSITAGDTLVLSAEADGAAGAATSHGTWSFDFIEP